MSAEDQIEDVAASGMFDFVQSQSYAVDHIEDVWVSFSDFLRPLFGLMEFCEGAEVGVVEVPGETRLDLSFLEMMRLAVQAEAAPIPSHTEEVGGTTVHR